MAKLLRCRDTGMNCNMEIRGNTEQEVFERAQEHARNVHNLTLHSNDATTQKVRRAIRDA